VLNVKVTEDYRLGTTKPSLIEAENFKIPSSDNKFWIQDPNKDETLKNLRAALIAQDWKKWVVPHKVSGLGQTEKSRVLTLAELTNKLNELTNKCANL
jgi:hypothetical protein